MPDNFCKRVDSPALGAIFRYRVRTIASAALVLGLTVAAIGRADAKVLAYWRFEQVQAMDGTLSPSPVGMSLTGRDTTAVDPRPYAFDEYRNNNLLQVWEPRNGSSPSRTVFTDAVPYTTVNGTTPNTRALLLRERDYFMPPEHPLGSADLSRNWTVEASVMANQLGDSQIFVGKDRTAGPAGGDLSLGFDAVTKHFYIEVRGGDGNLHRAISDAPVNAGTWYDLAATGIYDAGADRSTVSLMVKSCQEADFGRSATVTFSGTAFIKGTGMWTVGRGDANRQFVKDGAIDEVRITGDGL